MPDQTEPTTQPIMSGPAFPYERGLERGMTLRDYFAAKALPVFLADDSLSYASATRCAYIAADSMLAAREAKP